ncbi:MAG: D-glycerate dehydrogenase [Planctomycetota bacterium]
MGHLIVPCQPLPGHFEADLGLPDATVAMPAEPVRDLDAQLDRIRGASAVVTWTSEPVNDRFLDAAGDSLRVVAQCAVGYDNIDVPACRGRGVVVTHTPDMVTDGTADIAWALLLGAARRVGEGDRFARSGAWAEHGTLMPAEFIGQPIAGQTLLIVGAGRIGYATALRSMGWGMRVLYASRSPKPQFELAPLNAERVEMEDGLRRADFISVHTPLTPQTRHLLRAEHFALCKPTAVLVSTARGPVIDERALAAALRDGQVFAAGLDVFEREPEVEAALRSLENTLFTPHIGSSDSRCRARMVQLCAQNIRAVLTGSEPLTPVPG